MNGYRIAEAARQTGFSESALRFYEQEGVVTPERTSSGYRSYTADDIESLLFVARAKRLGLSLDEITELLVLLDDEECRPVQERMRELVAERIGQTQSKTADLIAFSGQLQRAAARLRLHTPDGRCDNDCGCKTDSTSVAVKMLIPLGSSPDIACSLDSASVGDRIGDWQAVLAQADARHRLAQGVTIQFPRHADVESIAALAAAEQTCCQFLQFAIRIDIDIDAVYLDVTGPSDAQPVIESIFGVAA